MAISPFRQHDAGVGYLEVLADAEERNLIWIMKRPPLWLIDA